MIADVVLTHMEYKVLKALKEIDLLNNRAFMEFRERYSTTVPLRSSNSDGSFLGLAELFLFPILNKKLNLNEKWFKHYLLRLEEKSCVWGDYYEVQLSGLDALERYSRDAVFKRKPGIISIVAIAISLLSLLITIIVNYDSLRIWFKSIIQATLN